MIEQLAGDYFDALTAAFFDSQDRLFWGYLVCACLLALLWLTCCKKHSPAGALRQVFSRASWWTRSARADYRVMALNSGIMMVLSPRLLSQAGVSVLVFQWMHGVFEGRPGPPVACPDWLVMISFTFCLFVLDDFSRYVVHRLLHRVPVLWSFHKVHHTATSLNPLTVYRTHPVEGVIFVLRSAAVQGVCIGTFVFFFGGQVTLATVFGAAVFNFAFNALGSNLRHSHIALGFWRPLERLFISPAQHQVHHSTARRHLHRNYGAALAVWDLAFGTHCFSEPDQGLRFGVPGETGDRSQTLSALYWAPFTEAWGSLRRSGSPGRLLKRGAIAVPQPPSEASKPLQRTTTGTEAISSKKGTEAIFAERRTPAKYGARAPSRGSRALQSRATWHCLRVRGGYILPSIQRCERWLQSKAGRAGVRGAAADTPPTGAQPDPRRASCRGRSRSTTTSRPSR